MQQVADIDFITRQVTAYSVSVNRESHARTLISIALSLSYSKADTAGWPIIDSCLGKPFVNYEVSGTLMWTHYKINDNRDDKEHDCTHHKEQWQP